MGIARLSQLLVKVNNLSFKSSFICSRWFQGVHVVQRAIGLSEISLNLDADKDHVISSYGVVTTGNYDVKSAVVDISPGAKGFVSNFSYQISQHRCYEREKDGLTNRVAY